LPDYKKIAQNANNKKEEKVEVTEKDVTDVIEQVRKQRAHHDYHLKHKDDTEHQHSEDEIEKHMPEFNDEFVKTLGNFENVEDFKTKARENILKEKEQRAQEKKRGELLEKLVAETQITLPQSIIDNEMERMFAQFETDIRGVGLNVEDYLKHLKKTPDDLAKEWRPDAEKRAKLNIILEEIAKVEKIEPEEDKVKEQVEHLTKHYKDIDPVRARIYTLHMLKVEKTVKFLEEIK
jgi:trigger factor